MIGDEMIRGISGGQKKRVTTGMHIYMNIISSNAQFVVKKEFLIKQCYDYLNFFIFVDARGNVNRTRKGFVYG